MKFGVYVEGEKVRQIELDVDQLTYAEFEDIKNSFAAKGMKFMKLDGEQVDPAGDAVQAILDQLKVKGLAVRIAGQPAAPGLNIPVGGVIVGVGEQKGGDEPEDPDGEPDSGE